MGSAVKRMAPSPSWGGLQVGFIDELTLKWNIE